MTKAELLKLLAPLADDAEVIAITYCTQDHGDIGTDVGSLECEVERVVDLETKIVLECFP